MIKIQIITVNYHQDDFIYTMLEDISSFHEVYLTIIDNSRTLKECKKENYQIISNDNDGYLVGLKKGLISSNIKSGQKVILSNPDIKISPNFIKKVLGMEFGNYNMIAPSVIDLITGIDQNPNQIKPYSTARKLLFDIEFSSYLLYFMVNKLKNILKFISRFDRRSSKKLFQKIFLAHGSIMIFNAELFLDFDFDTPNVFLWGEEAIIANWVHKNGGEIYYEPALEVFHCSKTATSKIVGKARFKIWRDSYLIYREFL